MTVHAIGSTSGRRGFAGSAGSRPSLLDVAAEVLVADPAASLAQVAEAAGIGRTTLHKHYATRDDLIHAVGDRALALWEQAVAKIAGEGNPDGGLRAATEAMIPIGPQLAFLWRTPAFDHDQDLGLRWRAVEDATLAILVRARDRGEIAATVPDWWLLNTFYSMIYDAAESVRGGLLASRDAPGLALRTFLHGLGNPQTPAGKETRP
jgi:AcrR family transcriptional regulator